MGAFPMQTSTACVEDWIVDRVTGVHLSGPNARELTRNIVDFFDNQELLNAAGDRNLRRIKDAQQAYKTVRYLRGHFYG